MTVVWLLHVWLCAEPGDRPGRAWGDCAPIAAPYVATLEQCRQAAVALQRSDLRRHAFCRRTELPE